MHSSPSDKTHRHLPADARSVDLPPDIDITFQLDTRRRRRPDFEAEERAVAMLASEMVEHPRLMLHTLARLAAELCRADAAGVSLLDGELFRWEAVAGTFVPYRDGTMPRHASPCGVVIDRNATQLMRLPHRMFPALAVTPPVVEALLVPFHSRRDPIGTVWVITQTSERRFDAEDARLLRTLAQFAAAGWQLWAAATVAEEASRRKDHFLATLAHELRNPLAALVAAVATLERTLPEDAANRSVPLLQRQIRHMFRLVDDMLDLSRIGAGKLRLENERVDFGRLVTDAVEARRPQCEARYQDLTTECPSSPIWLTADPVRVRQIVFNLLDNAQKFTPEHGSVHVRVSVREPYACLEVSDSGCGIARDKLEAIFDQYMQFDAHPSRSRGLGLGLALARRLAQLSGGSLTASSDGEGHGSCFTLLLPLEGAVPPELH